MNLLSASARSALDRARAETLSYGVRMYRCPGETERLLVVLGEAHLKLAAASALGRDVVGAFELRGVETFQRRRVIGGNALWVLIHVPRLVLRAMSFGLIKGSTITDAKELPTGHTVELERAKKMPIALHAASIYLALLFLVLWSHFAMMLGLLFWPGGFGEALASALGWLTLVTFAFEVHLLLLVPAFLLRRHPWSWLIHPAVGLVTVRDALMADGTVRMLEDHPTEKTAVVVMGRAHLPGFERELLTHHGFTKIDLR